MRPLRAISRDSSPTVALAGVSQYMSADAPGDPGVLAAQLWLAKLTMMRVTVDEGVVAWQCAYTLSREEVTSDDGNEEDKEDRSV